LLSNETLVASILRAVVRAVDVPVTLKIRTGPTPQARNAVAIARIAEDAGIAALAVHGRTRACLFIGPVEYATVRAVKRAVRIPVFANGDIATPANARQVLAETGADGLMIGRAAQGRPWIFREIGHFLATGLTLPPPRVVEARDAILEHLDDHYAFYGEELGVRIARKHLHWYTAALRDGAAFRAQANAADSIERQRSAVVRFFAHLAHDGDRLRYGDEVRGSAGAYEGEAQWEPEALAA
jgi:tRNA-dihydrouridine synthase B